MKSWDEINDLDKESIGKALQKLKHFETSNNLLALYVLREMELKIRYSKGDYSDQSIILGGIKNKTFSKIDIHEDLLEESLLDLAKAMLISFNKKGDIIINDSVRRASCVIEAMGNTGLGFKTHLNDLLKEYEIEEKFSERLNRK